MASRVRTTGIRRVVLLNAVVADGIVDDSRRTVVLDGQVVAEATGRQRPIAFNLDAAGRRRRLSRLLPFMADQGGVYLLDLGPVRSETVESRGFGAA